MDGSRQILEDEAGTVGPRSTLAFSKPRPASRRTRSFVISSSYSPAEIDLTIGKEAYSYYFVARAFAPLLDRLGPVVEVTTPESRLDYALWRDEQQGRQPLHLSFLPLHLSYLSSRAANVIFPSWEFPEIPTTELNGNPRNNWARIANRASLIVCHSHCACNAFLRAGVSTPLRIVPIPVPRDYFSMPPWEPSSSTTIECPCFEFPESEQAGETLADTTTKLEGLSWRSLCRHAYSRVVKPFFPRFLDRQIWYAACAAGLVPPRRPEEDIPCRLRNATRLSGIVYTTIFNPFDPRKNWRDLLTGFLVAFAGQPDVTLVVKLVLRPELLRSGLLEIFEFYQTAGLRHRCKVVLIWSYLSDEQMLALTRASTYYVNASRAEGSCLPLQNFLASCRPGVAPIHTGMADYFDEHIGFAVDSHSEPAAFPHDLEKRLATSWHRLVWTSLHDQLRASYQLVQDDYDQYLAMGERARHSMDEYASEEAVLPKLTEAIESL
jgi:glycosyltransferase involved in cell wall biosynthesis